MYKQVKKKTICVKKNFDPIVKTTKNVLTSIKLVPNLNDL